MAWTVQFSGLLMAMATIATTFADDELGTHISPEEFAAALANPSFTDPQPEGAESLEHLEQQSSIHQARYVNRGFVWANGIVPYNIHSDYSANDRGMIGRAMAEFENKTCIRFVPRTTQIDYLQIQVDDGHCHSAVGHMGGMQYISLSRPGCMYRSAILHELMHTLGFEHEQKRPDRDQYINMNFENIAGGEKNYQYSKMGYAFIQFMSKNYDYNSIMHYVPSNSRPQFTAKKEGVTFGHQGLTELDVIGIKLLYGCEDLSTIDNSKNCQIFAENSQCEMNTAYMCKYCAKSCKQCVSGCEKPWVAIGNSGCFLFENRRNNWDWSRKYCLALGADLAVIDTMAKRTDILDYMKLSKNVGGIWVGASDRSGSWQWVNGKKVTDGWESGYPDRDTGNDTCMLIGWKRDINFLRDWTCFNGTTPRKALCQKIDDYMCDDVCQNGGTCSGPNECTCPPYFRGLYCEDFYCNSDCLNGGKCTGPNECTCPKKFVGSFCESRICEDHSEHCAAFTRFCTNKEDSYWNKKCPKSCKNC